MIKDKEWLKEEINGISEVKSTWVMYRPSDESWKNDNLEINKGFLFNLIDELYEPKKPVIPKFVADWIEKRKKDFKSGFEAVSFIRRYFTEDENNLNFKVIEWIKGNERLFIEAFEYGYEIEKEQLYIVKVPKVDGVLACYHFGDVEEWEFITENIISGNNDWEYKFTEVEIKNIDSKLMAFAVPVEEV